MKLRQETVVQILTFSFLLACCSANQQLSKKDLKMAAGDIRTLALASGRMSDQFQQGELTNTFYLNQSELLLDKVNDTSKQLEGSGGDPEQEKTRQRLINISSRLQDELEKLQSGERVAPQELVGIGTEAKAIEDSLKEE